MCAQGFWNAGQTVFFIKWHLTQTLADAVIQISLNVTRWKKTQYHERKIKIEHGTFTPLVMFANSGFGKECKKFYSRLTELISLKRKEN